MQVEFVHLPTDFLFVLLVNVIIEIGIMPTYPILFIAISRLKALLLTCRYKHVDIFLWQ